MRGQRNAVAAAARELIQSLDGARDQAKLAKSVLNAFVDKADKARIDFEALIREVEEAPYQDRKSTRPPPRKR